MIFQLHELYSIFSSLSFKSVHFQQHPVVQLSSSKKLILLIWFSKYLVFTKSLAASDWEWLSTVTVI